MMQQAPLVIPSAQNLLDAIPASAAVVDRCGRIQLVNRRWLQFCLQEGGQLDSASPPRDYLEVCDQHTADGIRAVLGGDVDHFEAEYPCHGPDIERWFRMIVTPLEGGALIVHVDITGEYARVSRWLETTSSPMIELDPSGGAVFVNQAWADLQRAPRRSLLGSRWAPGLGDDDRQCLARVVKATVSDGADRTVDVTLANDEGEPLCIRFLVSAHCDGYRQLQRISLVGMDVTTARRLNEALAASAERERIAADIHDVTIQDLLVVGLTLQSSRNLREGEPELLADVIDTLDRSIADLRALGTRRLDRQSRAAQPETAPAPGASR